MSVIQKLMVLSALCVLHIHAELTTPIVKLENSDESGDESDESFNSFNDGNQNFNQVFNNNGFQYSGFGNGNSFVNNGGQSSSIYSNNGNNIVVNRRMGSNNEEETYISVSKPNIRIDGDYFTCSTLICPVNSYKCVVKSETFPGDATKLKTLVECQDKDDIVLERKEYTEDNPYPELKPAYKRFASVDREGGISTEDSNGQNVFNVNKVKKLTKEEQEEIQRNIDEQTRRLNFQLQQQQLEFQKQMEEMQKNLQNNLGNTFGNGFPFQNGNPFGNGFPFQNGNPFVNCSTLICPENTFKCIVMSKAVKKNRKKLLTLALCKNHNNIVLARKKYKEKNPYPDAKPPYKVTTSANRDGVILTKGTKSKELADNIKIFDKKIQTMHLVIGHSTVISD
ncbi:unnamed protein product [Diamesa hyperborea]